MLKVELIENGTVIDHISSGKGKKVLDILEIGENYENLVALVMNVSSKRKGKKDMIKMSGIFVKEDIINKVSLISPNATIDIIKDSKVVTKHKVKLPNKLKRIAKCPNPVCITNGGDTGDFITRFNNVGEDKYKCVYCERIFRAGELI